MGSRSPDFALLLALKFIFGVHLLLLLARASFSAAGGGHAYLFLSPPLHIFFRIFFFGLKMRRSKRASPGHEDEDDDVGRMKAERERELRKSKVSFIDETDRARRKHSRHKSHASFSGSS